MLWAERRCARGGVHERSERGADTRMAMGALWQRGQRGSTHGRSASEAVAGTRGARRGRGPGMRKRRSSRWRMRLRRERGEEAKRAELAMRATLDVEAGNPLPESGDGFCRRVGSQRAGEIERGSRDGQVRALTAVGEQPVVTDAVEAARQDVKGEAAQELQGLQCPRLAPGLVGG